MRKYRTLIILIKANNMYWMYFLKAWLLTDKNEKIKKILGMKIKKITLFLFFFICTVHAHGNIHI